METGSVAGTLVDSEEDEVNTPPPVVPLVLPHTMDIHARVEGNTFAVYSDSSLDTRILSLSRNKTLVLFTDGSHDAREGPQRPAMDPVAAFMDRCKAEARPLG